MDNFTASAQVVLPLLFMMLVGMGLRRCGLGDPALFKRLDAIIFRAFMPLLLFYNIYTVDLSSSFNPWLMGFAVLSLIALFALSMVLVPLAEKDNKKRASLIQAIVRGNFIIFGVSVSASLYGPENTGVVALLGSLVVPMINALSVIILEYFRQGQVNARQMAWNILKNPLVVGGILGIAFLLTGVRLPSTVLNTVKDLSNVTTPLALVSLGGSLMISDVKANKRPLLLGLISRLVLVPALFLPLSILLGFRGQDLTALMVMFAAPTAVSSYPMAQQMDADGPLAGQMVAFTTILSILTIFLIVFVLKELNFL